MTIDYDALELMFSFLIYSCRSVTTKTMYLNSIFRLMSQELVFRDGKSKFCIRFVVTEQRMKKKNIFPKA